MEVGQSAQILKNYTSTRPRVGRRVAHQLLGNWSGSRLVAHQVVMVARLQAQRNLAHTAPKIGFEKKLHNTILKLHNAVLKLHHIAPKLA